jgi:hypothetical protein
MFNQDRYITLMASLPALGDLFKAQQTPISRIQLEQRLKLLTPEDRAVLQQMENLLRLSNQPLERTDAEMVAMTRHLIDNLHSPVLKELVDQLMEGRTVLAALRRRNRGETAPPADKHWGYGRWVKRIERHWLEPGFRLEKVVPLVTQADRLLKAKDFAELERILMNQLWTTYSRLSQEHYFDFEAVVLYVLRWNLIERRVNFDRDRAVGRFHALVDSAIGTFDRIFA